MLSPVYLSKKIPQHSFNELNYGELLINSPVKGSRNWGMFQFIIKVKKRFEFHLLFSG